MTHNEWENGKSLTIHNANKEQLKWIIQNLQEENKKLKTENKKYFNNGMLFVHGFMDIAEMLSDEQIESLWGKFEDISVNPDTECLEEPFLIFGIGDHREKVWKWFDKHYSKGVHTLLYGK